MIIKVKVKPNSKKQEILKQKDIYFIKLKSPPENNKANKELINLLKKHFNKQIKIKSGLKNKNKIVEIK